MDTLKQKALDYTLGVLPKDESLLFEAMVEENDDARQFLAEAQEDFARIALSSKPKSLGLEVKERIMQNCQPSLNFDPFLSSAPINSLRNQFAPHASRYNGGGGSVSLNDLQDSKLQDEIHRLYENLITLSPLVAGDSNAAARSAGGAEPRFQTWLRGSPPLPALPGLDGHGLVPL